MAKDLKGKELPPGIRQRKNGRYEGRVMYDYESYSVYGNTVSETRKKMTELRYKLEHGLFVDKTVVTFDDWFQTWLETYKKNQVKKGTVIAYQNGYNYYVKNMLGDKKLSKIRGEHIQQLFNDLEKQGISVSYIKVLAAILGGCFKQAVKNGLIEANPVALVTLPRAKEKKERRVLTKEEQELFLRYARESYLYYLFLLALMTGLRGGEVRGLKYSDIDKAKRVIHIQRTLKYETGIGFFEDTPKTKTSRRDIPLTEDMIKVIEQQKITYSEEYVIQMNGYLFHLPGGGPISRERVQHEINRIVDRINKDGQSFEPFSLHCLRHTFATRAIENGMTPQTLKTILGHSSLAMTMDLYSHVLPSTKEEEMKSIAKAFKVV